MSVLAQLSYDELKQLDQGGLTWELYRKAATEPVGGLYFFTKGIWCMRPVERNLLTHRTHMPVCLVCEDDSVLRLLVEDPRKHLKSSIATVARPAQKLARRVVSGLDPCDRFAIYCSTTRNAERHWRDIRIGFESNEFFRFLFPELIPPIGDEKWTWNQSEGVVPRSYNPKEPTFDTLGAGKATSRHYDDITLDDMIDEENFDSPTAVEKAIEYFRQANNLLEEGSSRLIVVGNRWGMKDLNSVIHTEEPGFAVLSRSCWGPNLEGKLSCRNLPESVMELLRAFPYGDPLWPERFNKEELGKLLMSLKPRIFSAQYLNDPADPDAIEFQLDWIKSCELVSTEDGPSIRFEGDTRPVQLADCNLYITWDPAEGGKYAESENAIVVTVMDSLGRVAVIDEFCRKCDPLVAQDDFIDFAKKYAPWLSASGVEAVLFQDMFNRLLPKRVTERHEKKLDSEPVRLALKPLKTPKGMRKEQRIRNWTASFFEAGRVYVRKKCVRFLEQYSQFGVPQAKRDLIDAFAYGTQLWSKPLTDKDREEAEEREQQYLHSRGITGYGSALRISV